MSQHGIYERTDKYVAVPGYPDRPATIPENLWIDYWNRRKEAEEYNRKRVAERSRLQKIREQVSRNKRRLKTLNPPVVTLDSKWPRGTWVRWAKPDNWEPDDYRVLVRTHGDTDWRSAASINITFETREMYLSPSYLYWSDSDNGRSVEIKVEAIWEGVGVVGSKPSVYEATAKKLEVKIEADTDNFSKDIQEAQKLAEKLKPSPPYPKHTKPAGLSIIEYVTWWRNNPINSRWKDHPAHTDKYDKALLYLDTNTPNPAGLSAFSENDIEQLANRGQPGFRPILGYLRNK